MCRTVRDGSEPGRSDAYPTRGSEGRVDAEGALGEDQERELLHRSALMTWPQR
jgi:hypothetical protein